jgi:hypothetical protein
MQLPTRTWRNMEMINSINTVSEMYTWRCVGSVMYCVTRLHDCNILAIIKKWMFIQLPVWNRNWLSVGTAVIFYSLVIWHKTWRYTPFSSDIIELDTANWVVLCKSKLLFAVDERLAVRQCIFQWHKTSLQAQCVLRKSDMFVGPCWQFCDVMDISSRPERKLVFECYHLVQRFGGIVSVLTS